jgi:hypothetical protein
MQRQEVIQVNREKREDLGVKVQRAKDVIKQGESLRRYVEREGIYNLLQIEKARKTAQLLLGVPETKADPNLRMKDKSRPNHSSAGSSPIKIESSI